VRLGHASPIGPGRQGGQLNDLDVPCGPLLSALDAGQPIGQTVSGAATQGSDAVDGLGE
jgi:hypothetical protein